MTHPETNRVVVGVSATTTHWKVEIDLERGTATRHRPTPVTTTPIAAETLAALRAEAKKAHAEGDYEYRDQFADGDTEIVITLGGKSVTLLYVTNGVGDYARVQGLHDFACTCL